MKAIKTLSVLLLLVIASNLKAQPATIIIGLRSLDVLDTIHNYGSYVVPVFTDTAVNAVFANYTIYSMYMTYPSSRFPHMHRYYTIECNSISLVTDLQNLNSENVPYAEEVPEVVLTSILNDYGMDNDEINISPNPAENNIQFQLSENIKIAQTDVFDLQGRKRLAPQNGNNIDVSGLSSGAYFLLFTTTEYIKINKIFIKH